MIVFQLIQKPQKRGAEIFAAQLSERLQKLGHKVVLISLFEGVCDLPFSGEIIHLNRPLSKRWFDISAWKKLAKLVRQYNPDVVQCNAGDTLKYAVLSKLIFGWNSSIIARNASTVSGYIKSKSTKKINEFLYSKTAAIISVSEYSKNDLNQLFPATKNKSTVIPIGVENLIIHEVDWKEAPKASINIIHVGGFTFEKNHKGLLNIWKLFLKEQPNAILHLFGDGPLRNEIENAVALDGLQSTVIFYGWVANPHDYIAKADVLVLPSIIEGLPGVILEAMYCKTLVVANNVGGISEIVKPNETGFLAEKGDELGFATKMKQAIDLKTDTISNKAFKLVEGNFTNEYIAKQFEKEYLRISNGKN
jgi:glycosyltransferase involved in cell wall biosynthesis